MTYISSPTDNIVEFKLADNVIEPILNTVTLLLKFNIVVVDVEGEYFNN
jgi:hypothetical protein